MTPKYACSECLAYFASARQRDVHERRVHAEVRHE
jgi:hypothetical protein